MYWRVILDKYLIVIIIINFSSLMLPFCFGEHFIMLDNYCVNYNYYFIYYYQGSPMFSCKAVRRAKRFTALHSGLSIDPLPQEGGIDFNILIIGTGVCQRLKKNAKLHLLLLFPSKKSFIFQSSPHVKNTACGFPRTWLSLLWPMTLVWSWSSFCKSMSEQGRSSVPSVKYWSLK